MAENGFNEFSSFFDSPHLPSQIQQPDEEDQPESDDEETQSQDLDARTVFMLEQQAMNIFGAISREYERLGLIHPHDEFSWEWHSRFGNDFKEAVAAQAEAKPAELNARPASAPAPAGAVGDSGASAGTSPAGASGSVPGSGFASGFGFDMGGNF